MMYHASKSGERLDSFVGSLPETSSRSYAAKLIAEGRVSVNDRVVTKAGYRLELGDAVVVRYPEPVALELVPQEIELDIRYEDEDLLVVNKPRGMIVHPSGSTLTGTLVNALLARPQSLSSIGGVIRPGIVHRIDKDTSGLLVVAKNDRAHLALSRQFELKTGKRCYMALVNGITPPQGRIETGIARDPKVRVRMAVSETGRSAITYYRVVESFRKHSLLELRLETGRTHQIRVHMAHIGHPIVGDPVYGRRDEPVTSDGQVLHAGRIGFRHPRANRYMEFESELPDYFEKILAEVRNR